METVSKNPPVYGKRHVSKVWFGTGETLPNTRIFLVKRKPISLTKWWTVGRESELFIVPKMIQTTKLYLSAKGNKKRRYHALYDKVYRKDILWEVWKQVKANRGIGGIDKTKKQ